MSAREYLTVIKEQGWLLAVCVLLGLGAAGVGVAIVPPSFASQTSYYVASSSFGGDITATDNYSGAQLSADRVKSYTELVTGPRVAMDASAILGPGTTPVQIQNAITTDSVDKTVILNVSVTGPTPTEATRRATAVTRAFTDLVGRLETTRGPNTAPAVVVQVVQPPTVGLQVAPRPSLYFPIGGLLGLIVGFGAAVARRSLVRSITRPADLEDLTRTVVLSCVAFDRR